MKWASMPSSEMVGAGRESKQGADGPSLLVHHGGQWIQDWTWSGEPASGAGVCAYQRWACISSPVKAEGWTRQVIPHV